MCSQNRETYITHFLSLDSPRSTRKYEILRTANILYCETSEDARERIMMIIQDEISRSSSQTVSPQIDLVLFCLNQNDFPDCIAIIQNYTAFLWDH